MARSALFTLTPPTNLNYGGLGWRARTVTVNNTTGQWWDVDGFPISPYTIGVVISLRGPTEAPRIRAITPTGFTSVLVTGETGTCIFDEVQLPASPGVPFTRAAASAPIVSQTNASVVAPTANVVITIPANAEATDILVVMGWVAVTPNTGTQTLSTPANMTLRATIGGAVAGESATFNIYTGLVSALGGAGATVTFVAALHSAAGVSGYVLRGYPTFISAAAQTNGNTALITIAGPTGLTAAAISLYFRATNGGTGAPSTWAPLTNLTVLTDSLAVPGGGVGGSFFDASIVTTTTVGTGQTENHTRSANTLNLGGVIAFQA